MFTLDNIIWCTRWWELVDYHYTGQDSLPEGIVCVDICAIPEFFKRIDGNNKKYTIISCRNDYGLCEQRYNHPAYDLIKWTQMQVTNRMGYNDLHMPARINRKKCNQNDKYSIKCYSFTDATFDKIPKEVSHWFLPNNCINDEPRITTIPFGIHEADKEMSCVHKLLKAANNVNEDIRINQVYVNWQFYTWDRFDLYHYFSNLGLPNNTLLCEREKTFEEYLHRLATYRYIVCPPGNGWDCFRTLEAAYMGATPVIINHPSLAKYDVINDFPCIIVNDFKELLPNLSLLNNTGKRPVPKFNNWINWEYWKNRITYIHNARHRTGI